MRACVCARFQLLRDLPVESERMGCGVSTSAELQVWVWRGRICAKMERRLGSAQSWQMLKLRLGDDGDGDVERALNATLGMCDARGCGTRFGGRVVFSKLDAAWVRNEGGGGGQGGAEKWWAVRWRLDDVDSFQSPAAPSHELPGRGLDAAVEERAWWEVVGEGAAGRKRRGAARV